MLRLNYINNSSTTTTTTKLPCFLGSPAFFEVQRGQSRTVYLQLECSLIQDSPVTQTLAAWRKVFAHLFVKYLQECNTGNTTLKGGFWLDFKNLVLVCILFRTVFTVCFLSVYEPGSFVIDVC